MLQDWVVQVQQPRTKTFCLWLGHSRPWYCAVEVDVETGLGMERISTYFCNSKREKEKKEKKAGEEDVSRITGTCVDKF
jgi:hypothetical protein